MSLEKVIQQQKFESEHHKAAINVLVTGNWLYSQNATFLKQYDLTPEQFNVLRILRGSYPRPMMLLDITARMIDKSSNCTRLVEKLRQKGLVKREICGTNRRQVDILITKKGLTLLTELDTGTPEWLRLVQRLSKAEVKELNRMLDKVRG